MDKELLRKSKYILNKMRYLLNNPDDIVSTRYNINDILEENGLDSKESYEELYTQLNYMVNLELENTCSDCVWYSANHIGTKTNYCRVLSKDVKGSYLCGDFRHINTIG